MDARKPMRSMLALQMMSVQPTFDWMHVGVTISPSTTMADLPERPKEEPSKNALKKAAKEKEKVNLSTTNSD